MICSILPLVLALSSGPSSVQGCESSGSLGLVGPGTPGLCGVPVLESEGAPLVGFPFRLRVLEGRPGARSLVAFSKTASASELPALGGTWHPSPTRSVLGFTLDANGNSAAFATKTPVGPELCGLDLIIQGWVEDQDAAGGAALTPALSISFGLYASGPLFLQQPEQKMARTANTLRTAELNGDGRADLLVGSKDHVSIHLGRGDGSFVSASEWPVAGGGEYVQTLDLNADGWLDLVTLGTGSEDANLSTLLGQASADGTPSFALEATYGAGTFPSSCEVGDLDGDALTDVVAVMHGLSFLAPGGLRPMLTQPGGSLVDLGWIPSGSSPTGAVLADLDLDGDLDAAATSVPEHQVMIHYGQGNGSFTPGESYSTGGSFPFDVLAEDLNLDGRPDLAIAQGSIFGPDFGSVSVLTGDGTGSFGPAWTIPVEFGPTAIDTADLNGDLIPDLATANYQSGDGTILLGQGDGTFAVEQVLGLSGLGEAVLLADWNGDQMEDCALGSFDEIRIFLSHLLP